MNHTISQLIIFALCLLSIPLGCSSDRTQTTVDTPPAARSGPVAARDEKALSEVAQLTDRAFKLKKSGRNGPALELLERAHQMLTPAKPSHFSALASNLDDQASINVRLGQFQLARSQYQRAQKLLGGMTTLSVDDRQLLAGIAFRLDVITALEKAGITCREPLEPLPADAGPPAPADAGPPLPYFPKVVAMHQALDKLHDTVDHCVDGPRRPRMVRLVITGDGRIVLARDPGGHRTPAESSCIEAALIKAAVSADLPRFKACFRPFYFPFRP